MVPPIGGGVFCVGTTTGGGGAGRVPFSIIVFLVVRFGVLFLGLGRLLLPFLLAAKCREGILLVR